MKVKILAHGVDPDGIISHALIERYYQSSTDVIEHCIEHQYVDYPDLAESLEQLSKVRNDRSKVYVADLNFNNDIIHFGGNILRNIQENNSSLAWFDHHDSSIRNRKLLERFCFPLGLSSEDCASRIVANKLLGGVDEYANSIAEIAQAHDFRIESGAFKLGEQLQDIIKFRTMSKKPNNELDELVRLIATEQAWNVNLKLDNDLSEEVMLFQEMKKEAYQEIFSNAEIHIIGEKKAVVAHTPSILYMKDGPFYLQKQFGCQVDYFISIFDDDKGSVVIFGKPGQVEDDLTLINYCGSRNGGGRVNMGGFYLGEQVTTESYQRIRNQTLESFQEVLERSND